MTREKEKRRKHRQKERHQDPTLHLLWKFVSANPTEMSIRQSGKRKTEFVPRKGSRGSGSAVSSEAGISSHANVGKITGMTG